MRTGALLTTLLFVAGAACAQTNTGPGSFEVNGMGGAGGMYTPTISPFDAKLMLLSCDMSGDYRSLDGGKKWEMIHRYQLNSSLRCRPAFTEDAIYWATNNQLKTSKDKGLTWTPVMRGAGPWGGETITVIVTGPAGELLVGTDTGVWFSPNGGTKWDNVGMGKAGGAVAAGGRFFAAVAGTDKKVVVYVSQDGGKKWEAEEVAAAKGNPITSMAGAATGKSAPVVVATVQNVGVVRRSAEGQWEVVAPWNGQNDILMPQGQAQVVYAAQDGSHDIFRTEDGGKTWKSIFRMTGGDANVEKAWVQTQLHWDYSISPLGLGIDPKNPDVVLVSTQGDFYRSDDGGKKWYQIMNKLVGKRAGDSGIFHKSTGLEVTSVWNFVFDPQDENRRYICYTDIGFARTIDKNDTFCWSAEGCPWGNTFYEIAFDPGVKGRIYAATSSRHDIPHWTNVEANRPGQTGGVCVSDDHGATWKVLNDKLPQLPCTSLIIDPRSPKDKLTMYACFFEGGVYKTTDSGKTWEKKSEGLGNAGNLHCYKVRIDPKSGNLYCLITAMRVGANKFPVNGGIWKSTDGGDSWTDVTASAKLAWPTAFVVDPQDENTMYVTACTIPGSSQGGMYKTTDGGKTWKHILTDEMLAKDGGASFTHGMAVQLHPDDPQKVYFGSGSHALWYSKDGGANFEPFRKFPFSAVQNVTFDPKDHKTVYVSTFGGGVWKGPAEPVND